MIIFPKLLIVVAQLKNIEEDNPPRMSLARLIGSNPLTKQIYIIRPKIPNYLPDQNLLIGDFGRIGEKPLAKKPLPGAATERLHNIDLQANNNDRVAMREQIDLRIGELHHPGHQLVQLELYRLYMLGFLVFLLE